MNDWQTYLQSIYYDPKHPGSLTGPKKLYEAIRAEGKYTLSLAKIKTWLKGQETYTMTRQVRRKFPRRHYVVEGLDSRWQSDLMDMIYVSQYNDGIKYLMIVIDIFSRYVWVVPLKSKQAREVTEGMSDLLKKLSRKPKVFQSDSGSEYKNHVFKAMLKRQGIVQLFALNETKASLAERVIKTLKMRLYRYMLKHVTYRYLDVLDKVVASYNRTQHRSLGRSPASVDRDNESEVRLDQYLIRKKTKAPKLKQTFTFKEGDTVRVSHLRRAFDREYQEKWSGEIFTIEKRYWSQGHDVYRLKDYGGESIEGTFYASELQKVTELPDQEYRIQEVLKKRTIRKQKQVLVKWWHWPKKYNSWIPEADIRHYQTL